MKTKQCLHKRKFGREVADNKIERVCSDCNETIDYVDAIYSGVIL